MAQRAALSCESFDMHVCRQLDLGLVLLLAQIVTGEMHKHYLIIVRRSLERKYVRAMPARTASAIDMHGMRKLESPSENTGSEKKRSI